MWNSLVLVFWLSSPHVASEPAPNWLRTCDVIERWAGWNKNRMPEQKPVKQYLDPQGSGSQWGEKPFKTHRRAGAWYPMASDFSVGSRRESRDLHTATWWNGDLRFARGPPALWRSLWDGGLKTASKAVHLQEVLNCNFVSCPIRLSVLICMCWRASAYFGSNQVVLLGLQVPNSVEGEPNSIPCFEIMYRSRWSRRPPKPRFGRPPLSPAILMEPWIWCLNIVKAESPNALGKPCIADTATKYPVS